MGYAEALQEAYNANVLFTKRVQKNDLGLIFGVPDSKWRCASFSFRLDFWVCEDLVAGRIHLFLPIQNELSQASLDDGQLLRAIIATTSTF